MNQLQTKRLIEADAVFHSPAPRNAADAGCRLNGAKEKANGFDRLPGITCTAFATRITIIGSLLFINNKYHLLYIFFIL
ncbi:hypothetical protein [Neisseria dentiae]|uniref:hypothetical protein n=1 Tax=Neisseria dentiae TaxID=194197 RepID=UPI00359F509A